MVWWFNHWYKTISLSENWKVYAKLQHRLIAEAFFWPSELQVNHKDGDKSNNRIDNLEYVTQSQNQRHSRDVLWNTVAFQTNHYNKWKLWKENHRSIPVIQYDKDLNFIKQWDSWTVAWNELWISPSQIHSAARWKRMFAHWFRWSYRPDDMERLGYKIKTKQENCFKKIWQYSKDWTFIREFISWTEASRFLCWSDKCKPWISNCCTWKLNTSHWYIWKFI